MKKLFTVLPFIFMLCILFTLPFLSKQVSSAVNSGISICFSELIPSLFPFLFLSSLTASFASPFMVRFFSPFLCPLLGITPLAVSAVITGFLGGFPSGCAESARLYSEGKISKEEAERLPLFCNNAGLMFTLGTIGTGHFSSFEAGLLLYFFHLFSSVICAVLTRNSKKSYSFTPKDIPPPVPSSRFPLLFTNALKKAIFSMALISGNFIVFRVITSLLLHLFGNSLALTFLSGLLEVTGGILAMPETTEGLILSAFLLSFNGFCVHMQSMAFFAPLKLSLKKCIIGKIFSAFLTAFLMYVSLANGFSPEKGLPPMAFYIVLVLIPILFLFPYTKKASDSV